MYYLLPAVLFVFSLGLTGQSCQIWPGNNESVKLEIAPGEIPSINPDYIITNPGALNDSIISPACHLGKDGIFDCIPEIRSFRDLTIAEEKEFYPGADRFYSKHRMMRSPYEKSFLIKPQPDNFSKYYLIIKDPITHRRTN